MLINSGGSYGKFNSGGIEFGINGSQVFHAEEHNFMGPKTVPAEVEVCDIKIKPKVKCVRQRPISS